MAAGQGFQDLWPAASCDAEGGAEMQWYSCRHGVRQARLGYRLLHGGVTVVEGRYPRRDYHLQIGGTRQAAGE